jgi:hypothetical protein
MSYQIHLRSNVVYVEFRGETDPYDIISLMSDPVFLPNVSKLGKLIYDFSAADEVNLDTGEVQQFAVVAKAESIFVERLHIVIVLNNPANRARAEVYKQTLINTPWQIDIVDALADACDALVMSDWTR